MMTDLGMENLVLGGVVVLVMENLVYGKWLGEMVIDLGFILLFYFYFFFIFFLFDECSTNVIS